MNSLMNLKSPNISLSGVKLTVVPFLPEFSCISSSLTTKPFENSTSLLLPSLIDLILKYDDRALTALDPTPFNPTDFLNTLESYFAPVLIFETTSTTFPKGIPRPKSLIVTLSFLIEMSIDFPLPMTYSSIELSITSLSKT